MQNVIIVDIDETIVRDWDQPNHDVIEAVRKSFDETGLPLVVITGRWRHSKHGWEQTTELLETVLGRPVKELIMREDEEDRPLYRYKVEEVQKRGYVPTFVYEDDEANIEAFGRAWPEAHIVQVIDGKMRPATRMERLLGDLRRAVLDG